ncbi:MAG: DUF2510 domain-containing protein [Actinobacteria bacterium]|nr:MAG: DUF2510 domain-containing protein [Actinomycetota bacterium]
MLTGLAQTVATTGGVGIRADGSALGQIVDRASLSWDKAQRFENIRDEEESVPAAPAGWYADPHGRHQHRYWDGNVWTAYVADYGVSGTDPA